MRSQIVVNGSWLSGIGAWGDLKYSTAADGGCEAVSWTLSKPRGFSHPALQAGKLVELKAQARTFWSGELAEPDFDPDRGWTYNAKGLIAQGDTALAFDAGGNTTSTPDTAIDQAIARGAVDWVRPSSISAAAFANTDQTDGVNKVNDLLFAYATSVSKRVRVDGDRTIGLYSDPTTPDYYLAAGLAQVGLADEDYVTDLYLRYLNKATRKYATVHVWDTTASGVNRKEAPVDLTPRGLMSTAQATSIGNGLLAKGAARYAMTQSVKPSSLQLTTPGGKPAALHRVRGGMLVRAWDVRTTQGAPLPYYDFVIGRTEYVDREEQIMLAAVDLADRNLTDVLTAALNKDS